MIDRPRRHRCGATCDAATEPARYRRVARLLEALPGEVNLARLFQVDMVKPARMA